MKTLELQSVIEQFSGFDHGFFSNFAVVETTVPHSVVYCTSLFYLQKALANPHVSAIVLAPALLERAADVPGKVFLLSMNPAFAYWQFFDQMVSAGEVKLEMECGIDSSCTIHPTAVIAEKVRLGKNVCVGPHVTINDYVKVDDNVELGPGVVVGSEGLQVAVQGTESLFVHHAGGVHIGRNSKVLANSVIARGLYPEWTRIGHDTFIALQVTVGHQSIIGNHCMISSNVVVGGSAHIGNGVRIGPSSTISSSVKVSQGAQVKLGSVVIQDVPPGEVVSGNFARNHNATLKSFLTG